MKFIYSMTPSSNNTWVILTGVLFSPPCCFKYFIIYIYVKASRVNCIFHLVLFGIFIFFFTQMLVNFSRIQLIIDSIAIIIHLFPVNIICIFDWNVNSIFFFLLFFHLMLLRFFSFFFPIYLTNLLFQSFLINKK